MRWDDVLAPRLEVVTRESDNELVVVLPNQGKYIVLNATGARVLRLADGSRTLRDIAEAVAVEFGMDAGRVEMDILRFAGSLVERGVLTSVKQATG